MLGATTSQHTALSSYTAPSVPNYQQPPMPHRYMPPQGIYGQPPVQQPHRHSLTIVVLPLLRRRRRPKTCPLKLRIWGLILPTGLVTRPALRNLIISGRRFIGFKIANVAPGVTADTRKINASPPAERDAIQQLAGPRSTSLALFGRLTLRLFDCSLVLSLPCFIEESVHEWGITA